MAGRINAICAIWFATCANKVRPSGASPDGGDAAILAKFREWLVANEAATRLGRELDESCRDDEAQAEEAFVAALHRETAIGAEIAARPAVGGAGLAVKMVMCLHDLLRSEAPAGTVDCRDDIPLVAELLRAPQRFAPELGPLCAAFFDDGNCATR
jgi:hypothetical protein